MREFKSSDQVLRLSRNKIEAANGGKTNQVPKEKRSTVPPEAPEKTKSTMPTHIVSAKTAVANLIFLTLAEKCQA